MVIGRKNYYQILMVDPSADADILAVVHRRLAQRYHPDMDPGEDAPQRMLEINQAYDVLRNPERRATGAETCVALAADFLSVFGSVVNQELWTDLC